MSKSVSWFAYACVAFICLSWGTTYLVLRIGVQEMPPLLFSAIRQVVAGGIMILTTRYAFNIPFPKKEQFPIIFLSGVLMITGGNGLVAWAELYVTSGVAALICSIMPVWAVLISVFSKDQEKPNATIVGGIVLGVIGIMLVFRENLAEFANPNYAVGIALTVVATMTWAYGSILSKQKTPSQNPIMLGGFHLASGGLGMFVISPFVDNYEGLHFSQDGVLALIYLIIVGSIASFSAYLYALQRLPVAFVSVYSYVNPLVAVLLGWIILDEKLNEFIWISVAFIIAGIWLVNRGYGQIKSKAEKATTGG